MQVFISDVHLTDGTSGETIKAGAFKLFRDNLKNLVQDVKKSKKPATELKIVLLGDIFDVIRSTKWLNTSVRPWDAAGPAQEAVVQNIIDGIITQNKKTLDYFKDIGKFAGQLGIPFELQYVIGNHDWLINRYSNIVQTVAQLLGITPPPKEFPTEICDATYGTLARHGDKYDKYNYTNNNRNDSSIGDVIVIELLNQFPDKVGKKLPRQQNVVKELKEVDNVRPVSDIPSWVLMVMSHLLPDAQQAIIEGWRECVDRFFKVDFIKKMGLWTRFKLWLAWRPSIYILRFKLDKFARIQRAVMRWLDVRYDKKAWKEFKTHSNDVKYIIYGHTHDHQIIPMDQVLLNGSLEDKIYFNTGTWRQTWNKAVFDKAHREFIGWKVLTYIAFYNDDENKDYSFEVWNGALG